MPSQPAIKILHKPAHAATADYLKRLQCAQGGDSREPAASPLARDGSMELGRAPAGARGMGTLVPAAGELDTSILTAPAALGVPDTGRTCAGCSQPCKRLH